MKAVIPVAGFGTRLRPHTLVHPKVLLPIADKPMIAHIIDKLIEDGVDELVFVVGYLGDMIESYIRKNYKIPVHFVEQEHTLGLGHAIFLSREVLGENEPVIIVLGDTLYDADLKAVMQSPHSSLGVKEVEDPRRFGIAILDEDGFVTQLIEKPQEPVSNLALVGLYFIKNSDLLFESLEEIIQKNIRTKDEYQLTDGLQLMIEKGEKMTVFNVDGWYDCGKVETVLETNHTILQKKFGEERWKAQNTVIIPPVYIHPTAKLENAVLGPNVTIGAESEIVNSVLSHCIVGEHSHIRQAILHQSIVGNHVRLTGKAHEVNIGDYSQYHL